MVIVSGDMEHGFIFEPGSVTLDYVADSEAHPREPREMTMFIRGSGRMAAARDLGQSQHADDHQGAQDEQHQLGVGQELPATPSHAVTDQGAIGTQYGDA